MFIGDKQARTVLFFSAIKQCAFIDDLVSISQQAGKQEEYNKYRSAWLLAGPVDQSPSSMALCLRRGLSEKLSMMSGSISAEGLPDDMVRPGKGTRYRVVHALARGTFGQCCVLKDDEGRTYAAKLLPRAEEASTELDLHSSLSHPQLVRLVDAFILPESGTSVSLMEYCPFGTLMDVVTRRGRLTPVEARYYTHQVVTGVKYLHSKNIVHGDLKPANLFISDWARLKIGDFGLSARVGPPDWRAEVSRVAGTPNYMAPEIFLGLGRGFPGDIWAIGCILFLLLVGKPPFQRATLMDTARSVVRAGFRRCEAGLTRQSAAFVAKLLDKRPEARPSAATLLADSYFTKYFLPPRLPLIALYNPPDVTKLAKRCALTKKRKCNVTKSKKTIKKL
ncbi:hypothetical protein AAG570_002930 [Ranatra chinensis]|uniref:Protein kinase domain-containing protein n=1 Tax=Ranatra chinensis TaxID=642074 RepID=A0ABD0Y5B1_9HEMI